MCVVNQWVFYIEKPFILLNFKKPPAHQAWCMVKAKIQIRDRGPGYMAICLWILSRTYFVPFECIKKKKRAV